MFQETLSLQQYNIIQEYNIILIFQYYTLDTGSELISECSCLQWLQKAELSSLCEHLQLAGTHLVLIEHTGICI